MYRLYTIPGSCSTGIHVLLNKLGQDVELISREEIENYESLVPTNQVPALQTDGELLTEGAAIVMHLLQEHGAAPLPGRETRTFRQWLMFNYATLHPTYSQLFMAGVKNVIPPGPARDTLIQHVADRLSTLWAIVETRLEESPYMAGDTPTVIDYLLALYASWGNAVPEAPVRIGPKARKLIENVVALPEFQRAIAREKIAVALPDQL